MNNLCVVEIKDAVKLFSDEQLSTLFTSLMGLKYSGYSKVYGENVAPYDTTDFFCHHLLICLKEKNNKLTPISGFKFISYGDCINYNVEFPGLSLIKKDAEERLAIDLESRLLSHKNPYNVVFGSCWTINHDFMKKLNDEERSYVKNLGLSTIINFFETKKLQEILAVGVFKVKTNLLFKKLGFASLGRNPVFYQKNIGREKVELLSLKKISSFSKKLSSEYNHYWANRVIFNEIKVLMKEVA